MAGQLGSPSLHERLQRLTLPCVLVAAAATIPLTWLEHQGPASFWLIAGDWLIWAVFAAEFSLLLATAPSRRAFVRKNVLSLVVVVVSFPLLPGILGLARVIRLFRLVRLVVLATFAVRGLRRVVGRSGLLYVLALTGTLVIVGGTLMSFVEPETVKGNLGDGIWWAVVTMTTVGYGDVAPHSLFGRAVAVLLMFGGIGLTATLAASVAAYFVGQDRSEANAITERLERIEQLLLESRRQT